MVGWPLLVILLYSGYGEFLVRVVRLVPAQLQGVVAELRSDTHRPQPLQLANCCMQGPRASTFQSALWRYGGGSAGRQDHTVYRSVSILEILRKAATS